MADNSQKKRENFRKAFDGFDYNKVAQYGPDDVDRLLGDAGIVRHRGKIEATINNAARAIELEKEFGTLAAYFWQFEPDESERPNEMSEAEVRKLAQTEMSKNLAKDLKKRGWKFFLAPQPPTHSCKRWDWSMTTHKTVLPSKGIGEARQFYTPKAKKNA